MWRQLFAAVVGVFVLGGVASAQVPAAMPAPVPAKAAMGAGQVMPASGAVYVRGNGGCSSCGSPAAVNAPFAQYGPYDRNGCGGVRSDAAFMFGSCKSFFDPCGDATCGGKHGHGRGGCGHAGCPLLPLAAPYGTKYSGCHYDTFLNH